MKSIILILICFILGFMNCTVQQPEKQKQEVDYVNPLIGTAYAGFREGYEGGGTMPFVGLPFAMTNFVAQTHENKMGRMIYLYEDPSIIGFTATHQPTIWMGDYGYVSLMPQTGNLRVLPKDRALNYSHSEEISTPYYYSVQMNDNGMKIKGEIAAASRCGIMKFTYPASDESHIIVQGINLHPVLKDWANDYESRIKTLRGYVNVDREKGEITGYNPDRMSAQIGPVLPNFRGYFIIQFDKPFESYGTWHGEDVAEIQPMNTEHYGTRIGAYISFKTKKNETIKVKVATSFISLEQARKNLDIEISDWDFDKVATDSRNTWQENLGRIKIYDVSEDQKSIFYTALYRTMFFPREFSEYGKYYSAFDDKVHDGISYNDFSLWDTFRALHPLLLLTQPERVSEMVQALIQMYKEGGWMPKWPNPAYTNIMIGTHADAMIGDAFVNGFRDYDAELAYEAMRKNGTVPPDGDDVKMWGDRDLWTSYEARGGLSHYLSLEYVPADRTKESVSRTIEFGIDDYCIAQVAKILGKTDDYNMFMKNSRNYKNLYNPETGFMAPRLSNGKWHPNPMEGFTEGSKWTYLFGAMHDPEGMIELLGGNEKFAAKLDQNFNEGYYRHDNEPGHHYIYLYNYCGQPWKTQELIRLHTSEENYRNAPLGINGNDDCGQMSAWYIFGVLGFYPVTPASGIYSIGAPQFPRIILNLTVQGNPKTLEIIANNLSEENKYIQSVKLDEKQIPSPFLSYQDLVNGNKLVFEMGPEPNFNWK